MSSGAMMASGLPDPTAAFEANSAAGGCPLPELLEMRLELFHPFICYAVGVFLSQGDMPSMERGLLDATAECAHYLQFQLVYDTRTARSHSCFPADQLLAGVHYVRLAMGTLMSDDTFLLDSSPVVYRKLFLRDMRSLSHCGWLLWLTTTLGYD